MKFLKTYSKFYIVTAIVVTMFFSCKNNFKEIQQIGVLQNEPIGVAEHINLKYTDSGRLKANLLSPKMLDYSNRDFAFSEFPDGVVLHLFDENKQRNIIVADYAIVYNETDLIDLRGNVIITSNAKDTVYTEQLYYNQKDDWIFTNQPVGYVSPEKIATSNAFDSNRDFDDYGMTELTGTQYLDE